MLPKHAVILQGGQATWDKEKRLYYGADYLAKVACGLLPLACVEVKADWDKYKFAAGPIRNDEMLKGYEGKRVDLVIAFHNDPGLGKGTRDLVEKARGLKIPGEIHWREAG